MKWLRERKYRLLVSLAAGLAAVLLAGAAPMNEPETAGRRFYEAPSNRQESIAESEEIFLEEFRKPEVMYGWWGTLYPKFCFSKGAGKKVKISFWLAKAFDW